MFRVLLVHRIPILLLATLMAGPAHGEPPSASAPANVRFHRYVYYPAQEVYYSTEQQIWFWKNDNGWSYGVHLPSRFQGRMGTGLPLRLATNRPFDAHAEVERRFGQPWRERQREKQDEDSALHEVHHGKDLDNG